MEDHSTTDKCCGPKFMSSTFRKFYWNDFRKLLSEQSCPHNYWIYLRISLLYVGIAQTHNTVCVKENDVRLRKTLPLLCHFAIANKVPDDTNTALEDL